MNILILGAGGREHAFAWKIKQSSTCEHLYIAPGNAGTQQVGINIDLSVNDFEGIRSFCISHQIAMVVVGPEDPLVNGIYDYFQQDIDLNTINLIGPSQLGAQLEGSKSFAKQFMQRHQIPTALYQEFTEDNFDKGIEYIQQHQLPIVLKADGLAAGKGVVICTTREEAITEYTAMIQSKKFGTASAKVVIEEFLSGIELSVFVLTDGKHYKILPNAKDYKRIGEGDTGLNTGGMGAISPVPFADTAFLEKVETQIIQPTIKGLQTENITYKGFVFIGLIKVNDEPYVIEYNCRMGDPETEVVLPRLDNDLVDLFNHVHHQTLDQVTIQHNPQHASTIVLVSGGYPEVYAKDKKIESLEAVQDSLVFHAGTKINNQSILTNGGRVLAITSLANDLATSLSYSLANAAIIQFEGKYYRSDIGYEFV